jgi:hypothetical protein
MTAFLISPENDFFWIKYANSILKSTSKIKIYNLCSLMQKNGGVKNLTPPILETIERL